MKPMHGPGRVGLMTASALLVLALAFTRTASSSVQERREAFAGILDEHPAIQYALRPATDRVARLARAIDRGQPLVYEEPGGFLRGVLAALEISPASQLLVFSKTGIQRANTGPANPRALYFNDSVVVGYIPGARYLEIASHDPAQGVIFYTIDQHVATPDLTRRTNCLTCHVSGSTLDVPGLIVRSNFTNANGDVIPQLGFHLVDHRTPLSQRWGGWFVTGKYDLAPYGGVTHLGNVATAIHPTREDVAGTSNEILVRWLERDADSRGYASHDSDIAALLVFDHQSRAINLLTRLNWEARVAEHDGRGALTSDVAAIVDQVADYFLFAGEIRPPAKLTPRPDFAAHFTAAGPKDSRGRSLRQLDLEARLLTYPCSFMVYSPAFDGLPAAVRQAVYRRMRAILTGDPRLDSRYAHLSRADRRAIVEILRETKPDWPST